MDEDTIYKFFELFSKFECRLKRAGFLKSKRDGCRAEPNWDEFARRLGDEFFITINSDNEIQTIISSPPKKQIVKDSNLAWQECGEVSNSQELFGAVCRVRNNLFHGGKYSSGIIEGSERNTNLISDAIYILEQALLKSPPIKGLFDNIN